MNFENSEINNRFNYIGRSDELNSKSRKFIKQTVFRINFWGVSTKVGGRQLGAKEHMHRLNPLTRALQGRSLGTETKQLHVIKSQVPICEQIKAKE